MTGYCKSSGKSVQYDGVSIVVGVLELIPEGLKKGLEELVVKGRLQNV